MTKGIEEGVRRRAGHRCEYCHQPEAVSKARHQIDHIIARQHDGSDDPSDRALSCIHCDRHKGPNIARFDPLTGDLVRLYHPRSAIWQTNFTWEDAHLLGLTAVGRTTVRVLAINEPDMIAVREVLMREGRFPKP